MFSSPRKRASDLGPYAFGNEFPRSSPYQPHFPLDHLQKIGIQNP
jgi:hypothetical protein